MSVQQHNRGRAALITMTGSTANLLLLSLQGILLIPLYLHNIGPSLYGAWLGSGDIFVWLQSIDLVLPLMIRQVGMAHSRRDGQMVGEYFASGLLVSVVVAAVIVLIAVMLSFRLPEWMGLHGMEAQTLKSCFQLASLAIALQMVNSTAFGLSLGVQDTAVMNGVRTLSTVTGIAVSLWLIVSGLGLWSIALGMISRSTVGTIGGALFVAKYFQEEGNARYVRVRRNTLREFALISPPVSLGNLAYAMMNNSESALVAIFIRPELAIVMTLTRKLADIVQALVDMIGFSVYGSMAHLVASEQREHTLRVHAEISTLRLSVAVALGAAYMAVNGSFVSLWVGSAQYGGMVLTVLFALRMIIAGQAYLLNYLYRAIGSLLHGSVALLIESAVRIPLMIIALLWLGLPGSPIAGIFTAAVSGPLAYRWTVKKVSQYADLPKAFSLWLWVARIAVLVVAVLVGVSLTCDKWLCLFLVSTVIAGVGGIALLLLDPLLGDRRSRLVRVLFRSQIVTLSRKIRPQ